LGLELTDARGVLRVAVRAHKKTGAPKDPSLPLSIRLLGPLAFSQEFGEVEVQDAAAVRAHQLRTM
jgi:hypothetical protein